MSMTVQARFLMTLCLIFLWAVFILISPAVCDEEVRDPFQTGLSAPKPVPKETESASSETVTQLEGISIGPKGAFAVINGEIYQEGEQKEGIKIAQIRKKEVDILMYGAPMTLRIISEEEAKETGEQGDGVHQGNNPKTQGSGNPKEIGKTECNPLTGCL